MKRLFTLLILVLANCLILSAQTEVSGGIFTATTWTAASSPYVVTDEVVVFPGASLTIEPGVTVRFQAGLGLELRSASIYAVGTADAPITFTLDAESPTPGGERWSGIWSNTPLGTEIDMDFSHVTIEYAELGILFAGGGYRFVDNAIFRYNGQCTESDMSTGYDWVTFTNTEIYENEIGTQGRVSLIDCAVYNNQQACIDMTSFANGTEGARIINCTFTNNDECIVPGSVIWVSTYIENSTFTNNRVVARAPRVNASNSTFTDNEEYAIWAGTGTVEDCFFSGNGIAIKTVDAPYEDTIRRNIITANTVGIEINGAGAVIKENQLCDNTNFDAQLTTSENVDITENCWCNTDESSIPTRIFDAFDDVSVGIASYLPVANNCIQGSPQYPGDADHNGVANAWDILPLGLHYGETGQAHPAPIFEWAPHEAADWENTTTDGVNLKHVDTNGDGVINELDIANINLNYRRTHGTPTQRTPVYDDQPASSLTLVAPSDLNPLSTTSFQLLMASGTEPVQNCYGIAFALEGNTEFYNPNTFAVDVSDSWLGTEEELLTMVREFPAENRVEVAIVRIDGQPRSGGGEVARLNCILIEDLIISLEGVNPTNQQEVALELNLVDIEAVTHTGTIIDIATAPTEIILTDILETTTEIIRLYPNPADDYVRLDMGELKPTNIRLYNATGTLIKTYPTQEQFLSLSDLAAGLYFLAVEANDEQVMFRLIKQ